MTLPHTRRQMRDFRSGLIERLNGRPGTAISGTDFEQIARTSFDCVIPERSVKGDIDIYDGRGRGSSLKTLIVPERANRSRIWPEELGRRTVVMPTDAPDTAKGTQPAIIEIEHHRFSPGYRQKTEMADGDPQTAGNQVLRRMRAKLEQSCDERSVTESPTYSVILRHPDGVRLALAVVPLEIPDPAELTWRWQKEDEDTDPTSLEAFRESGELWGRWYLDGGHLRRVLVLDTTNMVRLRLPRSPR